MRRKKLLKVEFSKAVMYILSIIFCLFCLIPFLLVLGGSFTNEKEIILEGYKLIPNEFSLEAYKILLNRPETILNGYKVTIITTFFGTALNILITSMLAYSISIKNLKYKNFISFYVLFTLLFNGGMVPWYIVNVSLLHLKDNIFALIVPYLVNGFNVFLVRNYFNSIPSSIIESARIDGAGYFLIYRKFYMPLSKAVIATVTLFVALQYWNDWWLGIMLVDDDRLKPLQLILRSIVSNIYFLRSNQSTTSMLDASEMVPAESIKLATAIITIGPIILLYPYVQRYFIKGIMIGSVKG